MLQSVSYIRIALLKMIGNGEGTEGCF